MRFRLLSYNIHRAIGVDRKFRPERIAAILARYDADIVTLQEVDAGAPRSRMLDLAAHLAQLLEYEHHVVGLNVFLKVGRYGNATLSRFPIGRQRNIDLTLTALKRRGAQHTQILLPIGRTRPVVAGAAATHHRGNSGHTAGNGDHGGGTVSAADSATARHRMVPLELFNVHLSLTARMRARQVRHLLRVHELVEAPAELPCIVAGDMNDWRGLLHARLFAPAGFHCATNGCSESRWSLKTYPSFAPTGGLDKIFYRGPLKLLHVHRSRLALARVASDHLPVIADFEVKA